MAKHFGNEIVPGRTLVLLHLQEHMNVPGAIVDMFSGFTIQKIS